MRHKPTPRSGFFTPRRVLASSLVLGAISLAVIGFAAGSGATWSIVSSPNVVSQLNDYSNVYVHGIACISASECWSVGNFSPYGAGSPKTLIERWNGSSWSVADSPAIDSYSTALNAVTCASAADCWAVGSYLSPETSSAQTLIEHWDGAAWTIVPSPNTATTQNNALFGVTCASGSDCWTVGRSDSGTLVEHWDGNSWGIVSSPSAGAAVYNYLNDVTCVSGTDCWAAGRYLDINFPGGYKTLLEHWNGAAWAIVSSPNGNPATSTDSYLSGVTCTSSSDCWSVGHTEDTVHGGYHALVEHWNGSSWAIVSTSAVTSPVLQHVTCSSASDCWMVGYSGGHTLVEHWNGSAWAIVAAPNADPTQFNALYGVACVTGSNCWAAGQYNDYQKNVSQTLMEHWNGSSWTIVPSANPNSTHTNPEPNQLQGTACASDTDCWAVGYVRDAGYSTLIEHWDGNDWTIVNSPNTTSWLNQLNGVTCNSFSDCWAVGYSGGVPSQTLIEHWDGTTWSIVASPNATAPTNILYNVACATASECWAVGFSGSSGSFNALIEQWDGKAWKIAAAPAIPTANTSSLNGVACASATECWAVGSFQDIATGEHRVLIEEWNGTSWVKAVSPDPGTGDYLTGVSCSSPSDCWAAGYYYGGGTVNQMLFEHWNGAAWSFVPGPDTSGLDVYLSGVTCTPAFQCWAVGYQGVPFSTRRSLIASWDGGSWTITSSQNAGAEENLLFGAACSSDWQCWAVGYYSSANTPQTLIHQYSVPPGPGSTISVTAFPTGGGTVDGGGRYPPDSDVTLTAVPNSGYHFKNWTENGSIVSTSASYAFTAASNRALVANFSPVVSIPLISPNGGTFKKKVAFRMSSATVGATIYYTTDGTDPTLLSSVYPSASGKKKPKKITITGKGPHVIKAMGVKSGYDNSSTAVAQFTIN